MRPIRTLRLPLLGVVAAGIAGAATLLGTGGSFGWIRLSSAVTATGVLLGLLVLTHAVVLLGLRQRSLARDDAANTGTHRMLLLVLGIGVLLAVGFAASGVGLGVVPVDSAVAALGVLAVALSVSTVGILWTLRGSGLLESED